MHVVGNYAHRAWILILFYLFHTTAWIKYGRFNENIVKYNIQRATSKIIEIERPKPSKLIHNITYPSHSDIYDEDTESANVRDNLDVLRSFRFSEKTVKVVLYRENRMLKTYTADELRRKLLATQRVFRLLSFNVLEHVISREPAILRYSDERNQEIMNYLLNLFSEEEIRYMIKAKTRILMASIQSMENAYSVLQQYYLLTRSEIKSIVLQKPIILTSVTLIDLPDRVRFFEQELNLVVPSKELHRLVVLCPAFISQTVRYFLYGSQHVIMRLLQADLKSFQSVVYRYPPLFNYHPMSLYKSYVKMISFFTGFEHRPPVNLKAFVYRHAPAQLKRDYADSVESMYALGTGNGSDNGIEANTTLIIDEEEDDMNDVIFIDSSPVFNKTFMNFVENATMDLGIDMIEKHVNEYNDNMMLINDIWNIIQPSDESNKRYATLKDMFQLHNQLDKSSIEAVQLQYFTHSVQVNMTLDRAIQLFKYKPNIVTYSSRRIHQLLGCLGVSLGLTNHELRTAISHDPWLFSGDINGKLRNSLEKIARLLLTNKQYFNDVIDLYEDSNDHNNYDILNNVNNSIIADNYHTIFNLSVQEKDFFALFPTHVLDQSNRSVDVRQAAIYWRKHPVRTILRKIFLGYVPVLSRKNEFVDERLEKMELFNVNRDELSTMLARTPSAHEKWCLENGYYVKYPVSNSKDRDDESNQSEVIDNVQKVRTVNNDSNNFLIPYNALRKGPIRVKKNDFYLKEVLFHGDLDLYRRNELIRRKYTFYKSYQPSELCIAKSYHHIIPNDFEIRLRGSIPKNRSYVKKVLKSDFVKFLRQFRDDMNRYMKVEEKIINRKK